MVNFDNIIDKKYCNELQFLIFTKEGFSVKRVLAFVLAAIMCFSLVGCSGLDAELLKQLSSLEQANLELSNELSSTKENNEELTSELASVKEELEKFSPITDIESQVSSLNKQIEDLNTQIQEKQEKLDDLTSKVDQAMIEENRKAKEGTTVYEDKRVKINYVKIGRDYLSNKSVVFIVENKTNVTITIQCETLSLDGITIDDYITMSDAVAPQSKGYVYARADRISNDKPSIISGNLKVIDFDRSFSIYNANFVNIEV